MADRMSASKGEKNTLAYRNMKLRDILTARTRQTALGDVDLVVDIFRHNFHAEL